MIKGCLIVNAYYRNDKFTILYQQLVVAFERYGSTLDIVTNCDAYLLVDRPTIYDFVLFWDKDIYLAQQLENSGYRLFNSSGAIALANDKVLTYNKLHNVIDMPLTIPAPFAYEYSGYTDYTWLDNAIANIGLPVVIKESCGSLGLQVHLACTRDDAHKIVTSIGVRPMLLQRLVTPSKGKDIRVYVVGGKVIAHAMRKSVSDDFRSNAGLGGVMEGFPLSEDISAIAISGCNILGLDFGGVDILLDKDKPLLCEVNSNALFVSLSATTGVDIAGSIADYILTTIS